MRTLHRFAAVLAAGALVLTGSGTAQATPDDRSGRWLDSQLTDGLVHNDQYDFDDYGLTADTALALSVIGGARATVKQIRRAVAPHVDSWTTGVDFASDDVYAGSTAKAVVLAQISGADPRRFGGVDLVKRLKQRVSGSRPTVGRIQDASATDYANVIGQAFAAQGLASEGSPKAIKVTRFLLKQQCSRGYFRLNFADADAADQTCDGGNRASRAPDTDVTALAVLSLKSMPHRSRAVRASIRDAIGWLERTQKRNGSFGGGPATEASNTNSTGLAGWALGAAGSCRAAAQAAHWVKRFQVTGDVAGTPLGGEKGAIAYDRAAFAAAESDGIGTAERDQWRRATTQAAPSLINLRISACRSR